jgi:competence protein ComEA
MSFSMSNGRQSLLAIALGCALFLCSGVLQAGPVNINTADAATIAKELNGVGPKLAQAIVEYRQKNGPFKSVDELTLVKGIGPAAVAKNRELIRIDGGGKAPAKAPAAPNASLSE